MERNKLAAVEKKCVDPFCVCDEKRFSRQV